MQAQNDVEVHLKGDLVTNYIWRGLNLSSYFELSAPFRLVTCDWDATMGLVPWRSDYYEVGSFSVTNLSLRATKDIQITKSFALPLFGQLIANPASQHFYFVFGFTLKAL
jgi:hypothetical protein